MLRTGLANRRPPFATRGSRIRRAALWSTAVAVVLAGTALTGSDTTEVKAAAEQAAQEEAVGSAGLLDRLVALERELPGLPPEVVTIDDETTWAQVEGDFAGAEALLDAVSDTARELYVDASEADGPVAGAVSEAARALLELEEGYALLAAWETYDLPFPLEGDDADGVATGADEAYGLAQAGLQVVLEAHARRLPAYAVLSDPTVSGATDLTSGDRQLLETLHEGEVTFDTLVRPEVHRALSLDPTAIAHVVERFTTTAPGVEARARTVRVVCVPREVEELAGEDATEKELVEALGELSALDAEPTDCPPGTGTEDVRAVSR